MPAESATSTAGLARLEGWIEGERAGRTAATEGAEAGA